MLPRAEEIPVVFKPENFFFTVLFPSLSRFGEAILWIKLLLPVCMNMFVMALLPPVSLLI